MGSFCRGHGAALPALVASAFSGVALAQETGGREAERPGDIVVTANRQASLARETPVSVASISGEAMEDLGITRMEDFIHMTPGINIGGANVRNNMSIQLRGSSTATDPGGVDQSVTVFLDGLYLGRGGMTNMGLFDVERIEVLRGPQGTLWGRNVVGGAINVVTKDPGNALEAEAQLRLGNFDSFQASGRVASPLVEDRLFGQITYYAEQSDGWLTNDVTGNKLYGIDMWGTRGKLRYVAPSGHEIRLSVMYSRDTSRGLGRNYVLADPSPFFALPRDLHRHTQLPTDGAYDNRAFGLNLTGDWKLGENYTLTTVTGYFDNRDKIHDHSWVLSDPVVGQDTLLLNASRDRTFSQEIRIANDPGSRFAFQAGAIYYRNNASTREDWLLEAAPGTRANAFFGLTSSRYSLSIAPRTNSYALFGQGTFSILDWLRLTAGARYTIDRKTARFDNRGDYSPFHLDEPFQLSLGHTFKGFTPRVTLDALFHDIGAFDSLLLYATYARGWKSGGFQNAANALAASGLFRPETADSYEGGVKTAFWGNRGSLNLTLFHADYRNLQVLVTIPGQMGVQTANSHITGIELESALKISRNLRASIGWAWYDGAYGKNVVLGGEDVAGNPLYQTPRNSLSLGLVGDVPLTRSLGLNATINYSYRSESAPTFSRSMMTDHPDLWRRTTQSMLDGRIALVSRQWEFSIWGRNLLDDKVLRYTNDYHALWMYAPGDGKSSIFGMYHTPRTYGLAVKWTY